MRCAAGEFRNRTQRMAEVPVQKLVDRGTDHGVHVEVEHVVEVRQHLGQQESGVGEVRRVLAFADRREPGELFLTALGDGRDVERDGMPRRCGPNGGQVDVGRPRRDRERHAVCAASEARNPGEDTGYVPQVVLVGRQDDRCHRVTVAP